MIFKANGDTYAFHTNIATGLYSQCHQAYNHWQCQWHHKTAVHYRCLADHCPTYPTILQIHDTSFVSTQLLLTAAQSKNTCFKDSVIEDKRITIDSEDRVLRKATTQLIRVASTRYGTLRCQRVLTASKLVAAVTGHSVLSSGVLKTIYRAHHYAHVHSELIVISRGNERKLRIGGRVSIATLRGQRPARSSCKHNSNNNTFDRWSNE